MRKRIISTKLELKYLKPIFVFICVFSFIILKSQELPKKLDANGMLINGSTFGNVKIIKEALNNHAEINFKNKEGQTALYLVSKLCRFDLVQLLVEKGAEVNTSGNDKITPLHWAVEYDNIKIISYLLKNKADVHAIDTLGETPLHWASWTGNIESAKLLLKFGANPYKGNNGGTTPIDLAKMQEHFLLEKLLKSKKFTP